MKITCQVIEDLMPSYVDGLLSEDSKALVDEHLKTCGKCRKELSYMQEEQKKMKRDDEENGAKTLQKIKKKLLVRRILIAAIAAAAACFILAAGYSHWYWSESYVSYQDSGMYVENGKLYSTKNLVSRTKVFFSPDEKTEFIYAINAGYAGKWNLDGKKRMLVQDFTKKTKAGAEDMPEDGSTADQVQEVYYLSGQDYKDTQKRYDDSEEGSKEEEALVQQMKKDGKLLWSEK